MLIKIGNGALSNNQCGELSDKLFDGCYICNIQTGRSLLEYQSQAKQLFRRMNQHSPNKGSLETGPYLFQYVVKFTWFLIIMRKTLAGQDKLISRIKCAVQNLHYYL